MVQFETVEKLPTMRVIRPVTTQLAIAIGGNDGIAIRRQGDPQRDFAIARALTADAAQSLKRRTNPMDPHLFRGLIDNLRQLNQQDTALGELLMKTVINNGHAYDVIWYRRPEAIKLIPDFLGISEKTNTDDPFWTGEHPSIYRGEAGRWNTNHWQRIAQGDSWTRENHPKVGHFNYGTPMRELFPSLGVTSTGELRELLIGNPHTRNAALTAGPDWV